MTPDDLIAKWEASRGAELANAQAFVRDLCDVIGVPHPDATVPNEAANNYVFERAVRHEERGVVSTGRIDCYKRGCFILEAKQGADAAGRKGADPGQGDLLPEQSAKVRGGTARRGTAAWDRAMRAAFGQAKGYVADLPPEHPAPPFLIVVDVGHVIGLPPLDGCRPINYTPPSSDRSATLQ